MDAINTMNLDQYCAWLGRKPATHQKPYYAMYSSQFDAIVTDPRLMQVPVDDHLVHRGDGIFETLKCHEGAIYNLEQHMARLVRSAERIQLPLPCGIDEIRQRVIETTRAGGQRNSLVRLILSRGPGGFSVDPYECIGTQLYIVIYAEQGAFMHRKPAGASAAVSDIPVKPSFFATIKTCNYLPNALMKKQAVDRGVDFVIGVDDRGYLTEGPTENLCIVTEDGTLVRPPDEYILIGTTMQRGIALAEQITQIKVHPFTVNDVLKAREALIFGTSTDVTAVVEFEGQQIGSGTPGPVWRQLHELLIKEIAEHPEFRTDVFSGN